MMQRLTPLTSPIQIGANDETVVIASTAEGYAILACTHCGYLKSSYVLFMPGKTMNEFKLQQDTFKEFPRCLCPKREVSK